MSYQSIPPSGSTWSRIAVSSNGQNQDIVFSGEAVQSIEVYAYIINAQASSSTLTVQPNALSTNAAYQEVFGTAATPGATSAASMLIGFNVASAHSIFRFTMFTKSGTVRPYFGQYTYFTAGLAITGTDVTSGRWNDTSTAITKLTIHSDQANGIGSGSLFLYRLTP